jgi:hypothetical protein
MRRWTVVVLGMTSLGLMSASLGACVGPHQEVAALRMPLPSAASQGLAPYASPNTDYPSVGGNILKGTAPKTEAAYDATTAGHTPPPPASPVAP